MNKALQRGNLAPVLRQTNPEDAACAPSGAAGGRALLSSGGKTLPGDRASNSDAMPLLRLARYNLGKVDLPSSQRNSGMGLPATAHELALLTEQADSLLLRLARLRRNLREMRHECGELPASGPLAQTNLAEANKELFATALHAEEVAATAVLSLAHLARSSQHDALTNLPNRLLMLDRLEHAIATSRRHDTRFALLFIDLDNFKRINDTLGHAVGDQVLKLTARRLRSAVRDSDTVSRHGGEEFLVLLPELSAAADAALVAEKLADALAAPGRAGEHRLHLSASIGIAIFPEDGEDAQTLIGRADAAMYRAKGRGRGRFEFYAEKLSMTMKANP